MGADDGFQSAECWREGQGAPGDKRDRGSREVALRPQLWARGSKMQGPLPAVEEKEKGEWLKKEGMGRETVGLFFLCCPVQQCTTDS